MDRVNNYLNQLSKETDISKKLDIIKDLLSYIYSLNLSDLFNIDLFNINESEIVDKIVEDIYKYQTLENINIFGDFFNQNKFESGYLHITSNLMTEITKNISNDILNKMESLNNLHDIKNMAYLISNSSFYQNSPDDFNLGDMINLIDSLEEKMKIIDECSQIKSSTLMYIIINYTDNEKEILISKYIDKLNRYNLVDILKTFNNQNILEKMIDKCLDKLDKFNLREIIISINDEIVKERFILKYVDELNAFDLKKIIESFNDKNALEEMIDKCLDKLDDYNLKQIIISMDDEITREKFTIKYMDKLKRIDLRRIINSFSDKKRAMKVVDECIESLDEYDLKNIFDNLVDEYFDIIDTDEKKAEEIENVALQMIYDHIDKIGWYNLASIIPTFNDYDIITDLIDKSMDKLQGHLGKLIGNCNDFYLKSKLIIKYIDDLSVKDITYIISSLENIDDKRRLLKNFENGLSNENIADIISTIENLDEMMTFVNDYLNQLSNENILNIILSRKDKEDIAKLLDIYIDYLTGFDLAKIISKKYPDNEKEDLINKYKEYLTVANISEILSSLSMDNEKIKFIENNVSELNEIDLSNIISSFNDDNEKIKYLDKYMNKLDSQSLARIISSLQRFNIKLTLIEQYKDRLDNDDLILIAKKCRVDEVLFLMEKYSFCFDLTSLLNYLFLNYGNENETNKLVDKCMDMVSSKEFSGYLFWLNKFSRIDNQKIIDIINKNFNRINYNDIRSAFNIIESDAEKIHLLDDHIAEIDSKKIAFIISGIGTVDDKITLINKYANKLNKEDLIFIVIGQLNAFKSSGTKTIDYNNLNKLASILDLCFVKDESALEKCKYCITKMNNLDIFSLRSIETFLENHSFKKIDDFNNSIDVIVNLSESNSCEIQHLVPTLVDMLLDKDRQTRENIISQIESVFLKNNLPMMAKIYKVFDIMHPNVGNFANFDYQSPNLKEKNNPLYKQIIIFSDLMRITIGSNNRSLKEYVKHIEVGNELAKEIIYNDVDIDNLDNKAKETLTIYIEHLKTLYNNTLYGKNNPINSSGNVKKDLLLLISLFGKNDEYFNIDALPDRIVRMFSHFAGIDSLDELKNLMDKTIKNTDKRNRERALNGNFTINKGDFIKGLANQDKEDEFYTFLTNIFQNGSLCKEFLGDAARSDSTPMDTDVSRVLDEPKSFQEVFMDHKYASSRYGPLWIVLKNDDRFNETTKENNKYVPGKLEVFETDMDGAGHYGIRTGFATSDIDYLVVDERRIKLDRIKYEIVMNGFYIPLVNTKGELIFTPDEYDKLHENMVGLSKFETENEYNFAFELDNFDISNTNYNIDIGKSINEVSSKKKELIDKISNTGLPIKEGRSIDLSDKSIELIDIGSTGRGTNKMSGYDFDFIMRVDKEIYVNDDKMNVIFTKIKEVFPNIQIDGRKIRNQEVTLSNGEKVKLDITFIMKTDKLNYSTEECIKDRLDTIKSMDSYKYKKVLENIVLAKYVLKDAYKSKNASDNPQGGLGGVGIENWILQNGGSFERAARDFLCVAEGKSFEEFKKRYTIWDFGENNLSFKRDDGYTHDEFVENNMNEAGYNKMVSILKNYVYSMENNRQK